MSSPSPTVPATTPPGTVNPIVALLAALIAGGIAWGVIHATDPVFQLRPEFRVNTMGIPKDQQDEYMAELRQVNRDNAALNLAILGGVLAVALSAVRRSILGMVLALPIGVIVGGLAGFAGYWLYMRFSDNWEKFDLTRMVAVHALLLGGVGLAAGLAFGAARWRPSEVVLAAIGGTAAGAAAGALWLLVLSLVAPNFDTAALVPEQPTARLLWILWTAGLVGLVVALSLQKRTVTSAPAAVVEAKA